MHLQSDAIIEAAVRLAGEDRFHSDSFRDGLALIVSELNRHTALLEGARERLSDAAVGFLVNRLKVDAYLRGDPALASRPIERPIFTFGMPRTGTTLVSNLLAQDPMRRTLLNWEAMETAPPAAPGALTDDPRVARRGEGLEEGKKAFPELEHIHREAADGPTECLSVHKQDFRALWWDAQAPMAAYHEWMLVCDMVPAYLYQKRVLQVLQATNPGPWQLKMPSHALHIEALLKVYPDARLVWTHRDPFKAMGSLLSLIRTVSGCNAKPDADFLRTFYPRQAAEHLRRPLAVKRRLGAERIYDLHYADLLRDPIGQMRLLYRFLGDDFTPEVEVRMRAWLEENPQGRFGRHAYSLEQYGLTVEGLRPFFEEYLEAVDVEPEG